jgi:hypothetical protein
VSTYIAKTMERIEGIDWEVEQCGFNDPDQTNYEKVSWWDSRGRKPGGGYDNYIASMMGSVKRYQRMNGNPFTLVTNQNGTFWISYYSDGTAQVYAIESIDDIL